MSTWRCGVDAAPRSILIDLFVPLRWSSFFWPFSAFSRSLAGVSRGVSPSSRRGRSAAPSRFCLSAWQAGLRRSSGFVELPARQLLPTSPKNFFFIAPLRFPLDSSPFPPCADAAFFDFSPFFEVAIEMVWSAFLFFLIASPSLVSRAYPPRQPRLSCTAISAGLIMVRTAPWSSLETPHTWPCRIPVVSSSKNSAAKRSCCTDVRKV